MKSKSTAALLAFFLGGLGVHRFYLGQTTLGILYLLFSWTLIPGFVAFIDFIVFLATSQAAFDAKYNSITPSPPPIRPQQAAPVNKAPQPSAPAATRASDKKTLSAPSGSKRLCVNLGSDFPLHLSNARQSILQKVKAVLADENVWNKPQTLLPLFTEFNIRCEEIDQYIARYKPEFQQRVEEAKSSSTEFQEASEMDQHEMEEEFQTEALEQLYERANCDLIALFEGSEIPETIDDDLIRDFGFETISKYMLLYPQKDKIVTKWERKEFKDLLDANLAIDGKQIPVEEILLTQTLATLNKIAEQEEKHFKRKQKAVEYIVADPKRIDNIGKFVATRSLFKLLPLPEKHSQLNLEKVASLWRYQKAYLELLMNTYEAAAQSRRDLREDLDRSWIKGFEVEKHEDYNGNFVCQRARVESKKKYGNNQPPRVPFHVGCNCHLQVSV